MVLLNDAAELGRRHVGANVIVPVGNCLRPHL